MNLPTLVTEIQSLDSALVGRAASAVNVALTARNWLIGAYIVEFEQNGDDRAAYGERLIPELAKALSIRGLSPTILRHCRTFYSAYPAIRQSLTGEFGNLLMESSLRIPHSLTGDSPDGLPKPPPYEILTTLSFTHIVELLKIEPFSHANAGQLNTYLNWYREHEMGGGDNPPVGILLCTDRKSSLAKYALGGMDENLFVSDYQLQLPDPTVLEAFLLRELDGAVS